MSRGYRDAIAALLCVIVLSGSTPSDGSRWRQVKKEDSAAAYESFLREYPDSRHGAEARTRLETLEFEEAVRAGTRDALESFLRGHPHSLNGARARTRLEDLAFEQAQGALTVEAFEGYLRAYPMGRLAELARSRIAALEAAGVGRIDSTTRAELEREAQRAASDWLSLVDQNEWVPAWNLTTQRAKARVGGAAQFGALLHAMRETGDSTWVKSGDGIFVQGGTVGPLERVTRHVTTCQFAVQYDDRPFGWYVRVQYRTVFAQATAEEVVTLKRVSAGEWRNDGYVITLVR